MSTVTEGVAGDLRLRPDDHYIVVSADNHVGPNVRKLLRPYCEEQYLAEFDAFTDEMENAGAITIVPGLSADFLRRRAESAKVPGLEDPHARIRDMNTEGIAGEVVYHGGLNGQAIPFAIAGRGIVVLLVDPRYAHLGAVGVRIYNRWLADFVSVEPDRHVGVAMLPITDPEACVGEVEWAASVGFRAINLPAPRRDFVHYNEPVWEPFWAACRDHGMTLNTHAGGGDTDTFQGPAAAELFLLELHYLARRGIWHLIFSGVFERYPELKLITTEQFADWAPQLLLDMDSAFLMPQAKDVRTLLTRKPSEYWRSNCYIGASFMSRREAQIAADNDLADNILWGADYPHLEGTYPRTQKSMRFALADMEAEIVARLVGENALDVYGFDRSKLRAVADRIGPTVDEISTPYDPDEEEYRGWAFREMGKYF